MDGASAGDSLFLHYSGHGASKVDTSGEEEDGMDEVMLPCDFMEEDQGPKGGKRVIYDDDIFDLVVAPLKKGVSLVAVMDCCHSGTLMDLPYTCVLTPAQFQQLEEDMATHDPVEQTKTHPAVNAVAFLPKTTLRLTCGIIGAVDKSFDAVEQSLKGTAVAIEKSTGIGGGIKKSYLRLQRDLKVMTSFTFKFEPRMRKPGEDGEPLTAEEHRAELVHKLVY